MSCWWTQFIPKTPNNVFSKLIIVIELDRKYYKYGEGFHIHFNNICLVNFEITSLIVSQHLYPDKCRDLITCTTVTLHLEPLYGIILN